MRTESAAYRAARLQWTTQPRLFLRLYHIPAFDSTQEWAFSRDFASGPVLEAATEKLVVIRRAAGNPQRVDPIAGTSDIGTLTVELVNVGGEVARYIADPALPLGAALTTSASDPVTVSGEGATGYPRRGTLRIDDEDVGYTGQTVAAGVTTFTGITRAARGTVAAAHALGHLVHNGEQLRKGQRLTLFLGYAPAPEEDYGPGPGYVRLAVESLDSQDAGQTWTIRAIDIQRFMKTGIFTRAVAVAPATLGPDHPLNLALKILTSTGLPGTGGVYDVLPADMGVAMPPGLIDFASFEYYRDHVYAGRQMSFREIGESDAKTFIEDQCLRPLNLVPFISQAGKYGVRPLRAPVSTRTGQMASGLVVAG